jgi:uncharacterized protein YecT (DUF1311 family)
VNTLDSIGDFLVIGLPPSNRRSVIDYPRPRLQKREVLIGKDPDVLRAVTDSEARTRFTTPMCKTFQSIFPKLSDWIIYKAWEFAPMCLLLLLLCSAQVRAAGPTDDDTTPDPIDKFYNDCIDRNGSTAGMSDCTRQAARMWDAEMNKAYNKLLNLLGPTKSQALRESQRAWILFRDQELRAIGDIYSLLQGTMYVPAQEYSRLRLLKERTLLLRHYVSLIAESRGTKSPVKPSSLELDSSSTIAASCTPVLTKRWRHSPD